jgi:hypothetical protein
VWQTADLFIDYHSIWEISNKTMLEYIDQRICHKGQWIKTIKYIILLCKYVIINK